MMVQIISNNKTEMAANIFRVKVNSIDKKTITTNELVDYCFEMPELDFDYQEYIDLLSIKLDKTESLWDLTYNRFLEILKENHVLRGDDLFLPLINEYGDEFKKLIDSYSANNISYLIHPLHLIWNNILGDLNVKDFKVLPVHELDIELAQDHDGIIAFPNHRGLGINSVVYREFMIRVLNDLQSEGSDSERTIKNWFNSKRGNLYPEYPERIEYGEDSLEFDGDEGFIWGIKESEEIVIELNDTDFSDKYRDCWWVDRVKSNFEYWKDDDSEWVEANKEYPFKVKRFFILLHPAWFNAIVDNINYEDVYNSTAYGY
jgi:hypothetical protein